MWPAQRGYATGQTPLLMRCSGRKRLEVLANTGLGHFEFKVRSSYVSMSSVAMNGV